MARLVNRSSALDVQGEKQADAEKVESSFTGKKPEVVESLASFIDKKWEIAEDFKSDQEDRMLRSLRACNGEYESDKLTAMKQMFGANYTPIYVELSGMKCNTTESWLIETLFQTGKRPYSLEPTPIPELPASIEEKIKQKMMMVLVNKAAEEMSVLGGQPDMYAIMNVLQEALPELNEAVMKEIRETAKETAVLMEDKVQDQFVEGDWYQAVQRGISDFVRLGTFILKGPCLRKSPVRIREYNDMTGKWDDRIEERIIPVWERRSPFNIYPSPDSTADDIPWIFDKISLSRRALSDLIGVQGYDEEAIREVLKRYRDAGLRDWTTVDDEKASAEGKDSSLMMNSENIDCYEFHGSVPGSLLVEWGMSSKDIPDQEREYDAIVWKIDDVVIKAMLNQDPLRKKYFYRAGFIENPDSFWGRGIPELLEQIQSLANSIARAIAHNIAISAGPQVELNVDRLAPGENEAIYPWKVWKVTNQGMQEGKAVEFYQPNIITQRLLEAFNFCMSLADEISGVPRYMQGNAAGVSGAGETASGLNMLMTHAAKGIRNAIRNIDMGIIVPSVEGCYHYNLEYEKDLDVFGDVRVVAMGSSSLVAKEQQVIRRTEFLNTVANPMLAPIIGQNGFRELLKENIRSLELDPDKILGDDDEFEANQAQQGQMGMMGGGEEGAEATEAKPVGGVGGSPPAGSKSLGPDGAPVAGRDNQQFASRAGVKP